MSYYQNLTNTIGVEEDSRKFPETIKGLNEWMDPIRGVSLNGSTVSNYIGKINGFSFSQSAGTQQPVYNEGNNTNHLFDGSDDLLEGAHTFGLPTGSPDIVIFLIVDFISVPAGSRNIFNIGPSLLTNDSFRLVTTNEPVYLVAFNVTSVRFGGAQPQPNVKHLVTIKRQAGTNHNNTRLWINTTEYGRSSSNTNNLNLGVGASAIGAFQGLGPNIKHEDFLIFNNDLSNSTILSLQKYFIAHKNIIV